MIRKATQIAVPIVGAPELETKSLISEYEKAMEGVNELLGKGWRIFSTHTVNNTLTTYLVYVLTKIEFEKGGEEEYVSTKQME